jgi:4-cresol dehydrogenase (hydroxylating) flavoprotein subunit
VATVEAAVEAFVRALGADAVLTSEVDLREYRDPYDFQGSDAYTASAVVTPTSTEEVQAVVRIANEHKVPLWTFGQGRNYAYGGPAPRVRGSVLVSLRNMNRVLEVNDELAYAVLEPGVRFFDLHDHLQAGGHRLWPSIPALGWGSVVGNTLEYGVGYGAYGEHATKACGLEVVLPDGDVLRTGMGAITNSRTWHAHQWSFGPSHQWLFFQSNLGIVTKMGVWLRSRPEVYISAWARFADDATVAPVTDAVRELMLDGAIGNPPVLGYGLSIGEGQTSIDEEMWGLRFALYGREPVVRAQYEVVRETLEAIPGVEAHHRLYRWEDRYDAHDHNDKVQAGIPGMEMLDAFKVAYGEDTGHLDVSLVGPTAGADLVEANATLRELYARSEFPFRTGVIFLPRSLLNVSTVVFDTSNERQTRAAYDTCAMLAREMTGRGYPIYRTNIQHMDLVADVYDFNDHAQRRLNERLKDMLDPNGILSPGKQGIWPKAMRGAADGGLPPEPSRRS